METHPSERGAGLVRLERLMKLPGLRNLRRILKPLTTVTVQVGNTFMGRGNASSGELAKGWAGSFGDATSWAAIHNGVGFEWCSSPGVSHTTISNPLVLDSFGQSHLGRGNFSWLTASIRSACEHFLNCQLIHEGPATVTGALPWQVGLNSIIPK